MKIFIEHPFANKIRHFDDMTVNLEAINEIENASSESLNLNNALDYISPKDRDKILSTASSKIKINGKLMLSGIDLYSVSNYMSNGLLTIEEFNTHVLDGRLSADCIYTVQEKITKLGLKIHQSQIDGFVYTIIAERPEPNVT